MPNPLNYVTQQQIKELGLTPEELATSYQPSLGGVYHFRGSEGKSKTLLGAHLYKYKVDNNLITPYNAVGNLTFKGKYGIGFTTLKGDDLKQYLWDCTHKPYRDKFIFIDEIDSEFPARSFTSTEQTEVALRLWHTHKLGNTVVMTSHLGNSTDLIIHLASHYNIYPEEPDWLNNIVDYAMFDKLHLKLYTDLVAYNVIPTMLIYNRRELTEDTEEEQNKIRPSLLKKQKEANKKQKQPNAIIEPDMLDFENELEWRGLNLT